jgi:hypothetical protein
VYAVESVCKSNGLLAANEWYRTFQKREGGQEDNVPRVAVALPVEETQVHQGSHKGDEESPEAGETAESHQYIIADMATYRFITHSDNGFDWDMTPTTMTVANWNDYL